MPEPGSEEEKQMSEDINKALVELVDYASALLSRCLNAMELTIENVVSLTLFRHVIELTDSIQVQIENKVVAPTILQLRSIFETLLYLEFIFVCPKKTSSRVRSYEWHVVRDQWKYFQSFVTLEKEKSLTPKKRKFFKMQNASIDLYKEIKRMEAKLSGPEWEDILNERDRLKMLGKNLRNTEWFTLFPENDAKLVPQNLADLAKTLCRYDDYKVFFVRASKMMHPKDIGRHLKHVEGLRSLRDLEVLLPNFRHTTSYVNVAIGIMIRQYRSEEEGDYNKWYREHIQTVLNKY
ncbi:MAG: hypothetical protein HN356_04595 [Calditrichaeota bacterium]|nr:hypothetical protein [Calditrichota bacterium]